MAWALVTGQHANARAGSAASSKTIALPSNWTSGNKILIATNCWRSGNTGTITVTDDGPNSWVKLVSKRTAVDNGEVALWSSDVASTPGANPTITMTLDGSGQICGVVGEFSGLGNSGSSDLDTSGTGAANNSSPTATTVGNVSADGYLGLAIVGDAGYNRTYSSHTGYTNVDYSPYQAAVAGPVRMDTITPSSGATFTAVTDVSGSAGWGYIAAVIKLAGGGGGVTVKTLAAMGVG